MSDIAAIKNRMEKLGLTQAELAQEIGVGAGQVSHLLNGRRRMQLAVFRRIDEALSRREMFVDLRTVRGKGLRETPQNDFATKIAESSVTVEQIKARRGIKRARLTKSQTKRMQEKLAELGEALKRAPVLNDLTEEELLGYDEMP